MPPYPTLLRCAVRRERDLRAATDPATPPGVLDELARRLDHRRPGSRDRVAKLVAANPSTPPSTLSRLADRPGTALHRAVLRNPAAPVHVLQRFVHSAEPCHRAAIADSPAATEQVLLALVAAHPEAIDLPLRVLRNPALSDGAFERLAEHVGGRWPDLVDGIRRERADRTARATRA